VPVTIAIAAAMMPSRWNLRRCRDALLNGLLYVPLYMLRAPNFSPG
jgi:hypothetical protein